MDTDHVWGVGGSPEWVWKVFMRGHNLLFMDPYDDPEWTPILAGQNVGVSDPQGTRAAMGHTRTVSQRVHLARLKPASETASTRYCLADPGVEYLVYQPKSSQDFTVKLPSGSYHYEWFDPSKGTTDKKGEIKSSGDPVEFHAPFSRDALLLLKKQ